LAETIVFYLTKSENNSFLELIITTVLGINAEKLSFF